MEITCSAPDCTKTFEYRLDHGRPQRFCSAACAKASRDAGLAKRKTWANQAAENSIYRRIVTGHKPTLKKLGMSREEAKKAFKAWERNVQYDSAAMERWYRYEVQDRSGYGGGHSQ